MVNSLKIKVLAVFLIFVFLLTTGLGCKWTQGKLAQKAPSINLVYWRVEDEPDDFGEIITRFRALYPHITIIVKTLREEEYKQKLLEAWAEDKGPDLFSIPVSWLYEYKTKILPLPQQLTMIKTTVTGTLKKEEKLTEEKITAPSLRDLRETYVETVPLDAMIDNQIYGLPFSMNVLALYYNRDLLNNAGIPKPPETWEAFVEDIKLSTLLDKQGNFVVSGAALGGYDNVNYLVDILSLLMMQNGANMAEGGKTIFDRPLAADPSYFPGEEALRFYTDFANPAKEVYSWNKKMPNSMEAFIQGKTAFYFGYPSDLEKVKSLAPKLNFDVAPIPQIAGSLKQINYGNYWLETVSKKTKYPNEAWDLLLFASQSNNVSTFLERAKKPTSHRALIAQQLEDYDLSPFAKEVLTVKTWYKGGNYALVKEAFTEMVKGIEEGTMDFKKAIRYGVDKVNLSY